VIVCFLERELLPIEVLHYGNICIFDLFGSRNLDLAHLYIRTWFVSPVYWMCENKHRTSRLSKVAVLRAVNAWI